MDLLAVLPSSKNNGLTESGKEDAKVIKYYYRQGTNLQFEKVKERVESGEIE